MFVGIGIKNFITQRFPILEVGIIKKIPGLELFSFFSAFQQVTNFSITRPEASILLEYIKNRPPETLVKKPIVVIKRTVKSQKTEPVRATSVKKNKPAAVVNTAA